MTPERLKEIREILDQEIYITNHRVHFALKAADELYDEVSSRMPVSVEERLPGDGDYVLAYSVHECIPQWRTVRRLDGEWWTVRGTDFEMDEAIDQITHWMPMLPVPFEGLVS
jgi:hypothetical protein